MANQQEQTDFINKVSSAAQAGRQAFGVPASVTIAQAIQESGWGTSSLSADANNYFGIKGVGPTGESVILPTTEYIHGVPTVVNAKFRKYDTIDESFSDHARLIATEQNGDGTLVYADAMSKTGDPDAFADALTGIYATDPNYGTALRHLIHTHNLYQYDVA